MFHFFFFAKRNVKDFQAEFPEITICPVGSGYKENILLNNGFERSNDYKSKLYPISILMTKLKHTSSLLVGKFYL